MLHNRIIWRIRGLVFRFWIRIFGGHVGAGAMIDRGVSLRSLPHSGIRIGKRVYIGRSVLLDIPRTGSLTVGDDCLISHFTVIAASESVSLGDKVQVAESCSIRDADHGLAKTGPIREQPQVSSPIVL